MREAMANTDRPAGVPLSMQRKLRQIRLRHIVFVVLRALALSVSILIIAMVTAMIIDWGFVLLSTSMRVTLTGLALGLAAVVLIATAIPDLARVLRAAQPALDADRRIPELQERWTTVTDVAASQHKPTSPVAKAMLQQVTSEAIAMGVLVQPKRVVRPQVLRPSVYALCGTVVLLTGFLVIDWPQTRLLLKRFWAPAANITATQLNTVSGDVTIARHEPLELVIRQTGLHRQSGRLTIEYQSGASDTFELNTAKDQPERFVHAMRAAETFRYRLQAGDARTPWHDVTVIDYPTLAEFQMQIVPPQYVDRPPYQRQTLPSRVRAIAGSRLTLRMKPVAPLEQLTLAITIGSDDHLEEHRLVLSPGADQWYHFECPLLENLAFTPTLLSPQGLTDEIERTCQIEVVHDHAPVARIISPTDQKVAAADDVIEVRFEAHDDFGIQAAELVVYDETQQGETPRVVAVQEIPLGEQQGSRHVMMSVPLDLNTLALREGANISYAVRVTDNRMVQQDALPTDFAAMLAAADPGEASDSRPAADVAAVSGKPDPQQGRDKPAPSAETDADEPPARAPGQVEHAATGDAETPEPVNPSHLPADSSLSNPREETVRSPLAPPGRGQGEGKKKSVRHFPRVAQRISGDPVTCKRISYRRISGKRNAGNRISGNRVRDR